MTFDKCFYFQVSEAVFDGVPIRLYVPKKDKTGAAIVYFHGGGWVLGNPGKVSVNRTYYHG